MARKRGSVARAIMVIVMILLLGVGGFATYLFLTQDIDEKETITMYLDTNGGDIDPAPKGYLKGQDGKFRTVVKIGDKFGVLPTPTKYGNVFAGWSYDSMSESKVKPNDKIDFDGDFTLYAQWTPEAIYDYEINYLDRNGNPIRPSDTKMAMNTSQVTVDIPNIDGYTFNDELSEQTKIIGVNTVFNLYYDANVYYVSYMIKSPQIEFATKTQFSYGERINLIPFYLIKMQDPRFNISGKEFSHWQLNDLELSDGYEISKNNLEELGFSLNFNINPTNEIVLNAIYINAKYVVTFVSQGFTYGEEEYEFGKTISQPNSPNVAGYLFQGWYSLDTGLKGTDIVGKQTYNFIRDAMPATNLTLFAGFTLQNYTLTLDIGDGYYLHGVSNPGIYTVEDDFVLNAPVCDGKEFYGWTGMGIEQPVVDLRIYNMTGNRTYSANYGEALFSITYDLNGGQLPAGESNPINYTLSTPDITLVNPTKVGYNFVGWTGTDLDNRTINVTIPTGSFGNREYVAHFEAITYHITYEKNGGEFESGYNQINEFTIETHSFTLPSLNKRGYTFNGWIFDGNAPNANFTFVPQDNLRDVIFTADFFATSYQIKLELNGGQLPLGVNNIINYTVETEDFTLPEPTKDGYTFDGYTSLYHTAPTKDIIIYKGLYADNLVFNAVYTTIIYTITYNLNGGVTNEQLIENYTIESPDIILPNLTKDGYNFTGWTGNGTTTPTIRLALPTGSMGDKEFTANFAVKNYTITLVLKPIPSLAYEVELPSDWTKGTSFTYNIETETFTLPKPIASGWTFVGWTDTMDSENFNQAIIVEIAKGSTGDRTYYAWFLQGVNTITYELNGGQWASDADIPPSSYKYTDGDITPPTPIKVGYNFVQWELYDENGDLMPYTTIYSGSEGDRTFKAIWEAKIDTPYTVNHWLQNLSGNGYTLGDVEIKSGETDKQAFVTAKTYTGFTAQKQSEVIVIKGDGSAVVNFYYDRNSYTFTLTCQAGITATGAGTYLYGQTVQIVGELSKGYTFGGYYNGDTLVASELTYSFVIKGNTDYQAKANIITYTITYYIEAGAVLDGENPTTYNVTTPTFTLVNPTLEGATFRGWKRGDNDTPTINVVIEQGTTGNLTFTAVFTDEAFAITYNFNGGEKASGGYYPEGYTRKQEIRPTTPTRLGYDFVAWELYDENNVLMTKTYIEEGSVGDRTFKAIWQARNDTPYKVEIYLMLADGTYPLTADFVENYVGTTDAEITPQIVDREGYITPTLEAQKILGDGTTVFEVRYERIAYTVEVEKDDGISVVTGGRQYYWGQTVTIIATPKDGYIFTSWTQTLGENVLTANAGAEFSFEMPISNVAFMANSSIVTYTITYDVNGGQWVGGTNLNPTSYDVNTASFTLINPTRVGYEFVGWTGTDLTSPSTSVTISQGSFGNRSYVAIWNPVEVQYVIKHYQMNTDGKTYTLVFTDDTLRALTDSQVTPTIPIYEGFKTPQLQTKTISGDGSTVFEFYYDRYMYTVHVESSRGIATIDGDDVYFFGQEVTLTVTLLEHYNFLGWKIDGNYISTNLTYTFTIDEEKDYYFSADTMGEMYTITYDLNGDLATHDNPTTYEYGVETKINNPTRVGYSFMGWQVVGNADKRSIKDAVINAGSTGDVSLKAHWGKYDSTLYYQKTGDATVNVGKGYATLPTNVVIPKYVCSASINESSYSGGTYIVDEEYFNNGNANVYKVTEIRGGTDNGNGSYGINGYSFYNTNIESIEIPDTVTKIGILSFFQSGVKTISIEGQNLTEIGYGAFRETKLTSFMIPNSVTTMSERVFEYCENLTNISIGSGITTLPKYTFVQCSNLTQIIIPSNIKTVGEGAFYFATSLSNVTLQEGLETIELGAFSRTRISTLNIPSTLTSIGNQVFYGLGDLTTVTFASGSKLTSIGNSAFAYCKNLKTINIPSTVLSIGDYAFSECISLYATGLTTSSSLKSLGENAFQCCYSLIEIALPSSCTQLGAQPFNICYNLRQVTTSLSITNAQLSGDTIENVEIYSSASRFSGTLSTTSDGVVIWTAKSKNGDMEDCKIVGYHGDKEELDLTDLTNVMKVDSFAFYKNLTIRKVILPGTIQSLAKFSFGYCPNLETLIWSDITKYTIGGDLFNFVIGSYKLVQLVLPNMVYQFFISNATDALGNGSENLEVVQTDGENYSLVTTFGTDGDFRTVTTKNGVTYLYEYVGTNSEVDLTGYTNLYAGLFANNNNIRKVTIGEGTTTIADNMFIYCYNLNTVEMPTTITKIGKYAFSHAMNIEDVNISDLTNLSDLGAYSFELCTKINDFEISANVTEIKEGVFRGCFGLTTIKLNEGLTKIGQFAFQSTKLSASFTLPSTVVYIHEEAFKECEYYTPPFTGNKS